MNPVDFMRALRTGVLFASRTARPRSLRAQRRRLYLEPLEARVAPAVFTVLNTDDAGAGSLRQALKDAGSNAEADTITFDSSLSGQVILLTSNHFYAVFGPTALIIGNDDVTIDGSAAPGLALSGNNARRIFAVVGPGILTLQGITIRDGLAQGGSGSSGTGGGGGGAGLGGAVFINEGGTLNLVQSLLTGNLAVGGAAGPGTDGIEGGGGGGGMGSNAGPAGFPTGGAGGGPNGGAGGAAESSGSNGGFGGGGGGGGALTSTNGGVGGDGGFGGGGGSFALSPSGAGAPGSSRGGFGGGGGFNYGFGGGGFGGGGSNDGGFRAGGGGAGMGGAIFNNGGTVTITNTTIAGNIARGGAGNGQGLGGGVFNHNGTLTVLNSTFTDNQAVNSGGAAIAAGGRQIYSLGDNNPNRGTPGTVATTVVSNSILGQADTSAEDFTAKVITGTTPVTYTIPTTSVSPSTSTITIPGHGLTTGDPVRYSSGGGTAIGNLTSGTTYYAIVQDANTISLAASQAAALAPVKVNLLLFGTGNNAQTLSATIPITPASSSVTGGVANLIRTQSGFAGGIVSTGDPLLQGLADNGGPTLTYLPGAGSPAIDSGDNSAASGLTLDARGMPRTLNTTIDVGATETPAPAPPPPPTPPPTTTDPPNTLVITVLESDSASQKTEPAPTEKTSESQSHDVAVVLTPTVFLGGVPDTSVRTSSGADSHETPLANTPEKSSTSASSSGHAFDALEVDTIVVDELDEVLRAQMGSYAVKFEHEVLSGVSIARALLTGTTPRTDLLAQTSGVTPVATLLLRTGVNVPAVAERAESGVNPAIFLINPVPADAVPSPTPEGFRDGPGAETPAPKTGPTWPVWTSITALLGVAAGVLQHLAVRIRADQE